ENGVAAIPKPNRNIFTTPVSILFVFIQLPIFGLLDWSPEIIKPQSLRNPIRPIFVTSRWECGRPARSDFDCNKGLKILRPLEPATAAAGGSPAYGAGVISLSAVKNVVLFRRA